MFLIIGFAPHAKQKTSGSGTFSLPDIDIRFSSGVFSYRRFSNVDHAAFSEREDELF